MYVQEEFTLAQKCDLMIMGNSGYGDLVYNHMCCGFPLHDRGQLPQRCLCPPKVRLEQGGFSCEEGNTLVCPDGFQDKGGDITKPLDDPSNTKGANLSKTSQVFQTSENVKVWLTSEFEENSFMLADMKKISVAQFIEKSTKAAKLQVCNKNYQDRPSPRVKCP